MALLFILSGVFCCLYAKYSSKSLSTQLYKNGASIAGIENFRITDTSETTIFAKYNEDIIKIKFTPRESKDVANNYINKEIALFQGIFEPHLPPYPEFLTKEASCAEKYKPIPIKSSYGQSFILYAGDRFGYGVCADDLIKYRASIGYFYCENSNNVFQVEYFIRKEDSDRKLIDFNNSFTCR